MSEELLQRGLLKNPKKIGQWSFYNIGNTPIEILKKANIIRNIDYGEIDKRKVDGLIVNNKDVIAIIEYKDIPAFNSLSKKKKAIKQVLDVARKLGAPIVIATDTQETIWVNALTGNKISNEDGHPICFNFNPEEVQTSVLIASILASINEKNDQIRPKKLVNPTDLAKQIWQDIWSVSGATPENCLYTFIELFIFKYLSDLGILRGTYSFKTLLASYATNTPEEVLATYASNIRPQIKDLFPENSIDKTTIINGTIFVGRNQKPVKGYSAVFKKILKRFNEYGALTYIDRDFKSKLFESFLKESISKKNWGQFFTPLKVIRAIALMAKSEIKQGVKICDPACGVGKFLLEPILTKINDFYPIGTHGITPKITIHGFDKGFDKDEQKTIILAKANMLIYFSDLLKAHPRLTKNFSYLFNNSFVLKTNSILGTLADPAEERYDLILTNPPYVTSGSSNLKEEIKKHTHLKAYYNINAMGVEGLFMQWIIKALKPEGKAFIVVPDGIFNRKNDKNLRQFIINECYIDCIISLPLKTFFSTPKKTYILCLTKKMHKQDIQTDPVFTYLVSEIGESRDVYRFDITQDDLTEAVKLYNGFKGSKEYFIRSNNDPRCKIQPFAKFHPDNYWTIEKWWTKEEQIALGLCDEDKQVSIAGFGEMIKAIATELTKCASTLHKIAQKKKAHHNLREIKIMQLFNFQDGYAFPSSIYTTKATDTKLIRIQDVNQISNLKEVRIPKNFKLKHLEKYRVKRGTYLLSLSGAAGFNIIKWQGEEGYLNQRVAKISIKKEYATQFIPDYEEILMRQISYKLNRLGKGANNNLTRAAMAKITLKVPVTLNQEFDLVAQKEIAKKYRCVSAIKRNIAVYRQKIETIKIEIPVPSEVKEVSLSKLFKLQGGNAKFIKKYLEAHKGDYVVYSANTKEDGVFGYINSYDHDIECLQMTTDGAYAGTLFYRPKHKFSIHGDARLLIKKEESLDYHYLIMEVRKAFAKHKFNWRNKPTKEKIKHIKLAIPITKEGTYDLQAQRECAAQYKQIASIRKSINIELHLLHNVNVDLD